MFRYRVVGEPRKQISLTRQPLKIFSFHCQSASNLETNVGDERSLFAIPSTVRLLSPLYPASSSLLPLLQFSQSKSTGTLDRRQHILSAPLTFFVPTYFARMPLLLPRDGDSNFHSFSTVYEQGHVKSGWAFCMSKAYCKYATPSLLFCLRPS